MIALSWFTSLVSSLKRHLTVDEAYSSSPHLVIMLVLICNLLGEFYCLFGIQIRRADDAHFCHDRAEQPQTGRQAYLGSVTS